MTGRPTDAPGVAPDRLRRTLGRFATGVTVLTVGREEPLGMTANSFTSVSLQPPLVLVCVARSAFVHDTVLAEGGFALSILSVTQLPLARRFADPGRRRGPGEFAGVEVFRGRYTGAPLLRGALAWLECSVAAVHDGGDHAIVVGSVLDLAQGPALEPLLFFGGGFRG